MWAYDELILSRNRDHDRIRQCNEIVERFIAARNLVIYGGTAIDFCLRQHGDSIYSDATLDFADYDFYSPDVIRDAYELAQQLMTAMSTREVAIINAIHMRTTKVMFEGIMVADISYCAASVFERLETLTFATHRGNEVRFLAPQMQAIDMHGALSEPYMNPPNEVHGHRITRDIERFAKLRPWMKGPSAKHTSKHAHVDVAATIPDAHCLLVGLPACFELLRHATAAGFKSPINGIVSRDGDKIMMSYDGPALPLEFYVVVGVASPPGIEHQRLLDWFPRSWRGADSWIFAANKSLYPCWRGAQNRLDLSISAAPGVLKSLLVHAFMGGHTPAESHFYYACYEALWAAQLFIEGRDVSMPFAFGDAVWPSIHAPNESMSLIYGRSLTLANIGDRKNKTSEVAKVLSLRPPNLYLNNAGASNKVDAFLNWKPTMDFYSSNGEVVKKTPAM